MRKLTFAIALFSSVCSAAIAGPREEALQVIDKWAQAFTESDVDTISKLYATDALFLGTGSKAVVTKPEAIHKYFDRALLNNRPRGAKLGAHSVMVVSDSVVVVTGLDTVTGVQDGTPFSRNGRVTFVVANRGSGWEIVHFHRSSMPK